MLEVIMKIGRFNQESTDFYVLMNCSFFNHTDAVGFQEFL